MNKVIKWMILLVFLLESRFFYLFSLPEFIKRYNTYLNKAIIVGLILFGMIIIGIMTRYRYFKKLNFNKFILALLALYVVEFVISLLKYNQGIKYVYSSSCHLLIVLFYYILMYYAIKKGNLKYISKLIIGCSISLSLIFIIQAIALNSGHNLFLHIYEIEQSGVIPARGNSVRLTYPSTLISFSIIISFSEILVSTYKSKLINLFNVIVSSTYIIIVCQTRMLIIAIFVSCLIMTLIKKRTMLNKLIASGVIIIAVFSVLNSSYTDKFINSFSSDAEIGSNVARNEEVAYFMGQFKESPLFGRGFITPLPGTESQIIVSGPSGYLTTTDIGIVGLLSVLGISGLVLFIYLIIKLSSVLIKIIHNKKMNENIELFGIYVFLIITSTTLIVTDAQRIIILPLMLAFFDYKIIDKKLI